MLIKFAFKYIFLDSDECKLDDECVIELSKGVWKRLGTFKI
jgi:hypothetical protein